MSANIDDQIHAGVTHGYNVARIMTAQHGDDAGRAFCGGLVTGVRNYLVANFGAKCAFDLLQGLADSALDPQLALLNIEADIGDMVRDLRRQK